MEHITLSNGINMPMLGFGVFQVDDSAECERVVGDAIEVGYSLFDTAMTYHNEEAVGCAVINSGIEREAFFITSKVWITDAGYDRTLKAFDLSLKKLGLDYLDLYLIHMPFGDYYGAWRAMERLYKEGRIRSIGVCNFSSARLIDMSYNFEILPAVNQISYTLSARGRTCCDERVGHTAGSMGAFCRRFERNVCRPCTYGHCP